MVQHLVYGIDGIIAGNVEGSCVRAALHIALLYQGNSLCTRQRTRRAARLLPPIQGSTLLTLLQTKMVLIPTRGHRALTTKSILHLAVDRRSGFVIHACQTLIHYLTCHILHLPLSLQSIPSQGRMLCLYIHPVHRCPDRWTGMLAMSKNHI